MLYKLKDLSDYKLLSLDGEIGKVKEFYFDDHFWAIRYLVADTGKWLSGRKVLISPYALKDVIKFSRDISVNLTERQIEDSPSIESEKPVSKQFEESYYGYYGWPSYWGSSNMWGTYPYMVRDPSLWRSEYSTERTWDPNLRSTKYVSGHRIEANDGEIGHIDDFIVDDETWAIRYLVVDTRNWWPGKKVLISPEWIDKMSWNDSKLSLKLSKAAIRQSPEYIEGFLPDRKYESDLYRHYNQKGYWETVQAA